MDSSTAGDGDATSTALDPRAGAGNVINAAVAPGAETGNSGGGLGNSTVNTLFRRVLQERQRQRRRGRYGRSCLPCRERKVRCDRQRPCHTCLDRNLEDLCIYTDDAQVTRSTAASNIPEKTAQLLSRTEQVSDTIMSQHGTTALASPPSFVGGNSSQIAGDEEPPSQHNQSDSAGQEALKAGILPLLGIRSQNDANSGPDPPSQPWKTSCGSLPKDHELIQLFECYRTRAHPFCYIIPNLEEVESVICSFIGQPSEARTCSNDYLCMLHAIMALGAQFSDMPTPQRAATSQKHLKQALELLGTFGFLWKPSENAIRALTALAYVMQNDFNPGAAWVLSGIAVRLAVSLGIHKPVLSLNSTRVLPQAAPNLRLAVVWEDVLLSLAFERAPSSHELDMQSDLPLMPTNSYSSVPMWTYKQSMNCLCHLVLKHSAIRSAPGKITDYDEVLDALNVLDSSTAPHLRDRRACHSVRQYQEHDSFDLNRNFALSSLCRSVLSRKAPDVLSETEIGTVSGRLRNALRRSVSAFIRLRSLTSYLTRSWALTHNGLSSALLLSFMENRNLSGETAMIQTELIQSLSEGSKDCSGSLPSDSQELSAAHKKVLSAIRSLQKLAEDRQVVDTIPQQTYRTPSSQNSNVIEAALPRQDASDAVDVSSMDMGQWLDSFETPLEAFDVYMGGEYFMEAEPFVGDE